MKTRFITLSFLVAQAALAQINPYSNTIQNPGLQNSSLGGFNQIFGTGVSGQNTAGCFTSGYSNLIKYSTVTNTPSSNSTHVFGEHSVGGGTCSFALGQRVLAGTNDYNTSTSSSSTIFYSSAFAFGRDVTAYADDAFAIGSGLWSSNHSTDLMNTTPHSLVIGFLSTNATRPTLFVGPVITNTPTNLFDDYGTVGIGTNNTRGHTLAVRGDIIAEKMQVALYANWPDFVFSNNYQLQPLNEVEQFLKLNHHLQGIPDAQCVESEGYDLAQMDALLLQKIEELTLYMIQLKKENEQLRELIKK